MTLFEQLSELTTEAVDPLYTDIDLLTSIELVRVINNADKTVAAAVEAELLDIARVVDLAENSIRNGGRIVYVGAGTSGRLGILDASEMPPTYGTRPNLVKGIIAGGDPAVFRSIEGAEDSFEDGENAIELEGEESGTPERQGDLQKSDSSIPRFLDSSSFLTVGLSASGRTPFVLGALHKAHELDMPTVLISTNEKTTVRKFAPYVDELICTVVGPEVVAGSTRMKSGTAQKMIINMITTATMVRLGKTYGNVMVDVQLTNNKLRERARRIVMTICGVPYKDACELIDIAGGHIKTALVMGLCNCSRAEADERLLNAHGLIRKATL